MTTAPISASDVNKLRQMTGAGMMDCKKALTESNGDFEAAIDYLRKKGQKVAVNRADKEAKEGVVLAKTNADKTSVVLVALSCETDFVAKTADFIAFTDTLVNIAIAEKPANIDALKQASLGNLTVSDKLFELIGKIGEKIEIIAYEVINAPSVVAYIHPGNKLVSTLGLSLTGAEAVGKDIAMQIAAMNPVALDKDDVDPKMLEREIEIGKEQARAEGKPEDMLEKIALGKLNKFYKENTLLNQSFIKDEKITIAQLLEQTQKGLKVTAFKRFRIGG